jgi:hypothetical protein
MPWEIAEPTLIDQTMRRLRKQLPDFDTYIAEAGQLSRKFGAAREGLDFEEYVEGLVCTGWRDTTASRKPGHLRPSSHHPL